MSSEKLNILRALYDIRPVDAAGRVDIRKIEALEPVVNLTSTPIKKPKSEEKFFFGRWDDDGVKELGVIDYQAAREKFRPQTAKSSKPKPPKLPPRYISYSELEEWRPGSVSNPALASKPKPSVAAPAVDPKAEFEAILSKQLNVDKEIKDFGGETVLASAGKPRYKPIPAKRRAPARDIQPPVVEQKNYEFSPDFDSVLARINERLPYEDGESYFGEPRRIDPIALGMVSEVARPSRSYELERWLAPAQETPQVAEEQIGGRENIPFDFQPILASVGKIKNAITKKSLSFFGMAAMAGFAFLSIGQYGVDFKNHIISIGNSAVSDLEQAGENLKIMDFATASNNFAHAYEQFSKAGESLNFLGSTATSLFADLPGAGKLKSAINLVEAGRLMAEAGKSMSLAVEALAKTNMVLDLENRQQNGKLDTVLADLKKALYASSANISKAKNLTADIDASSLPEDKRPAYSEFQSKLPEFEKLVSDAIGYTDFFEKLIGSGGDKKYLVMFQNSTELRPTGGFPGTYGVLTFRDGRLRDFDVDDVYNLDGQQPKDVIPPFPLQHITPNWGMRDANWFIDFPVSAQKIIEYYKKASGTDVDGVLTLSPTMVADILKIVGPIEMPEYGYSINDENFISTLQEEIEYGDNRAQPKTIVYDMAPKLLEKIYSANADEWMGIFNIFVAGMERKDVLMYFKDFSLQSFVAEKGFGGIVANSGTDYLMVSISNVKGSKTDRYTENSYDLATRFEDGKAIHRLEITRRHNGGKTEYGFYNRQNPAFVRVLVPEGAKLIGIEGNDKPNFKPLIDYAVSDFEKDPDLVALESTFNYDESQGAWTYRESGKNGFAFWMITDPGQTSRVVLEYSVPMDQTDGEYAILVQKQPGAVVNSFNFGPEGGENVFSGPLAKDMLLRFKLR